MKAAILDIPDYAKGDQELWTPTLVKKALVDAYTMLRRTEGRVGPAHSKAAWPDHFDLNTDYPAEKTKVSPYHTRMTATRMEMVVCGWTDDDGRPQKPWLAGPLLSVPEYQNKLQLWVAAELRGEATVDLCLRKGWALASFKRHRDRAAGMIADRLNRVGVGVW